MAPLIADYLKRCVPFTKIREVFIEYDGIKKKIVKYQKISPRNLLEFFLQIIPYKTRSIVGRYLYKMRTFLPLTYWKYSFEDKSLKYHIDLSIIIDVLDELNNRTILINFGLDSKIGKTNILTHLFDIDEKNLNIDDDIGITREMTVDLYLTNQVAIFDINAFGKSKKFKNFFLKLVNFCDGLIFQISLKDKKDLKKKIKKLEKFGFDNFEKFFLILRDKPNNLEEFIVKLKKKFKKF